MKRKNRFTTRLLSVCALLLGVQLLPAQLLRSAKTAYGNYDLRDRETSDKVQSVSREKYLARQLSGTSATRTAALRARLQAAATKLRAEHGDWQLEMNRFASAPEILGTRGAGAFLTPDSLQTREKIARRFLSERADLFGLTTTEVEALVKTADYANPSGNLSWVEFAQKINGIPVFQGEMRAAFTAKGALARLTGNLAAGLEARNLARKPTLDPAQAVAAGAAAVGHPATAESFQPLPGNQSGKLSAGPFVQEIEPALFYFPLTPGIARLAYAMTLWEDVNAWYVLVDAEDGTLLFRKNITNDQSQPATYSVYDNDSPSPLSPTNVLPGTGTQPPLISRSSFNIISELPTFDNLGWITDGGTTTTGNNCDAGLDLTSPNGIDTAGRPVAADRNFTFAYNPAPGNPAPGDTASGATIRNGAVTNLFFWTNRYHDRLYTLGFTEAAKNFQTANFGRNPGGANANAINGTDAVRAEVQDSSGTDNANFSTSADGSAPRMQMYLFATPTPNRDGSLDGDVFIHEMTHGLSNRLHNNGSGLGTNQAGGMGEGWSDYYARCLLSTADENIDGVYASGGYSTYLLGNSTDNYFYGIRRFPYAALVAVGANGKPYNPLTFADIDPAQSNLSNGAYPENPLFAGGAADEVHNIGEVWCMMLLEMRATLVHKLGYASGNQQALQLVTDAMKLDPASPTFVQARDSILAADNASNGGANQMDIRRAFASRGLGAGASTNGTNVVESFSIDLGLGTVVISDPYGNGNGIPESGEDLQISVPLTNVLASTVANVRGTIGNYTAVFGNLGAGATTTLLIPFRVPAGAVCGSLVTVPITYASANGSATYQLTFQLGTPNYGIVENFDGVVAPTLPAGWTTTTAAATGGITGTAWKTVTSPVVDAANNCFSPDLAGAGAGAGGGEASLISPAIAIANASTQLSFKHTYDMEGGYDGCVLEIKIGAGAFTDIVAAGGSFLKGGYNGSISNSYGNPIGGRAAWTSLGTQITTVVNLPAAASGQNVQFRWRLGFDNQVKGRGWNVDSLKMITSYACASVDSDDDGLQDGYETANGLNPNIAADAALDADGDGQSNLQEYFAGTNLRSAASFLHILQVSLDPAAGTTITFPSVNGKIYRVEYRGDLNAPAWTVLQTNIVGTGGNLPILDAGATGQTQRFYRVVVLP